MSTGEHLAPCIEIGDGVLIPQLGLGTWPMTDDEAERVLPTAIERGYRLIDTAESYHNESGVGAGIRAAGIDRNELFITTKFDRQWHGVQGARDACYNSLERLGVDYLDLLLIHWPNPQQGKYVEAFEGLVSLKEEGLIRAAGTSNFKPSHLQDLFDRGFCPQLNQIQLDPYHRRDDIIAVHQQKGIVTEAWRPLGCGNEMLMDPEIQKIAKAHGRTTAQILLRWQVQQGFVTCPKSSNPDRLTENIAIFDFFLNEDEMRVLDSLDRPDPDMFDADVFGH